MNQKLIGLIDKLSREIFHEENYSAILLIERIKTAMAEVNKYIGGNMSTWKVIRSLNIHSRTVKLGMWRKDNKVYFAIEGLKPEDFVESDTWEFPVHISTLEQVVKEAKEYGRV